MAWNQPNVKSSKVVKRRDNGVLIGVVTTTFLVVFVLAVLALRQESSDEEISESPSPKKLIPAHKPTIPTAKPHTSNVPQPSSKPKANKQSPKPAFMDSKPRNEWDSREVALAYQWYAKDPNNRIEGIDMTTRVPPPVFSNLVQEAMAPYLEIGADVLPAGRITDEEAWAAIDTPIDFNYDDSDELLAKKQGVKEMLDELKQFMKDGGHAQDYFLRLESRQALEFETMQEVRKQVREFENEGDAEGAREALEVYNQYLENKGLPKIHMKIRNKQPQGEE